MMMKFECLRCGECCRKSGIVWSELDAKAAAAYLGIDLHEFVNCYNFEINEDSQAIEHPDFGIRPCPFVAQDNGTAVCTIYPIRPTACKNYPAPGRACRSGQKRPV